jgi:putative sterol carrier protein
MNQQVLNSLIARARARKPSAAFDAVAGTIQFEVEAVGIFRALIDRGKVTIEEGAGAANLIVRCDLEEFERVASGRQNLITAFMQGRVLIEGDLALAQRLHAFLPSPPKTAAPRAEARP